MGAWLVLSKEYPLSEREQQALARLADNPEDLKAHWSRLKKPRSWRDESATPEAAREHVERGGLVGILPSSISCVVLDVDGGGREGATSVIMQLDATAPVANMKSRTEDGRHLWFLLTEAEEIGNRTKHPKFAPLQVDVRGSNGFVWLWEGKEGASRLIQGLRKPIDKVPRKKWDDWFFRAKLQPPPPPPRRPAPAQDEARRNAPYLQAVIESAVKKIGETPEGGGRHTAVFAGAAECARHSAGRAEPIPKSEIFARLRDAGLASGLRDDKELTHQLENGWSTGVQEPRYPEPTSERTPRPRDPAGYVKPPEEPDSDDGAEATGLRAELLELAKSVDDAGEVQDGHQDKLAELQHVAREILAEEAEEAQEQLADRVRRAPTDHAALQLVEQYFKEQEPPLPMGHWYDAPLPEAVLWRCGPNSAATDTPDGTMLSVGEVTVLSGPGGLGKSTICLAIAAASAQGISRKAPVQACGLWVRPGPVVIQNHEDAPVRMKTRLKWYAKEKSAAAWDSIVPLPGPRALWRMDRAASGESRMGEGWTRLWRVVRETDARLVILDAAKYVFPGAPSADPGPIAEFYAKLSEEAERCRCGVLIVGHDTKRARTLARIGEELDAGAVAGSASWQDSARGVLYLHRDWRHPGKLVLEAIKANYGPDGWGALLGIRTVPFRGVDPQPERTMDRVALAARKAKAAAERRRNPRKKTKANKKQSNKDFD